MNKLKLSILILTLLFAFTACQKTPEDDIIDPTDSEVIKDDGTGVGTVTWTKDKTYVLDGFVFVNSGQTLTIEPGTVITAKQGQGANASALVIAQGGKINACGTPTEPIIFTADQDDIDVIDDIPIHTTGLWGGVIILGKAPLNSTPGTTQIEGIPPTEPRGIYGGSDAADNSGSMCYVSIRYGGTDIGGGNEINGLTLGGVGAGTEIHHIEVIFNKDDGIEFFGGTVGTKNMVAAFCGDDAFDYDEGFTGKGQFWFAIQSNTAGSDRGGEHDGGTDPETAAPYATPVVYNATYIGKGEAAGKRALTFRDNAGGEYHNSIFVEYGKGVDIEILGNGDDSYKQFENNNLKLEQNIFWNVKGNTAEDIFTVSAAKYNAGTDPLSQAYKDSVAEVSAAITAVSAYFTSAGNQVSNPGITVAYSTDGLLNPVPSSSLVASPASDSWYTVASYKGAFGTDNWLKGWTLLDAAGYLQQ